MCIFGRTKPIKCLLLYAYKNGQSQFPVLGETGETDSWAGMYGHFCEAFFSRTCYMWVAYPGWLVALREKDLMDFALDEGLWNENKSFDGYFGALVHARLRPMEHYLELIEFL